MKRTTAEWLRKAEADLAVAAQVRRSAAPLHDAVCFHRQQAAEKYLKGLLEEQGLAIPKTHDLFIFQALLLPHHPSVQSLRRGLGFLTQFAVEVRYPGTRAKKRQAIAAFRWANRVREVARALLGLPVPRRRTK